MNKIAKFEKVSYNQFLKDFKDTFTNYSDEEIKAIYDLTNHNLLFIE